MGKVGMAVIVACAGALAGCAAAAPNVERLQPVVLSEAQADAVRAGVRQAMKDPESARFGAIKAARSASGAISVCGYVNGRNSLGGYTGEQPFAGVMVPSGDAFLAHTVGGTASEQQVTLTACRSRGIEL